MSDTPSPWSRDGATGDARPQGQPSHQPQQPLPPSGSYPRPQWSQAPAGQPFQPSPQWSAPQATKTERPRRAGKLTAAVLGIALLAGGVGAGSAALTVDYLDHREQPAATSQQLEQGNTATQGRTVVQADPHNPNWTAVANVASQSVVAIEVATAAGGGQGSGVIIDAQGHIVTNHHVVAGAEEMLVKLGDNTYKAKLVGSDPATDLAVIKLVDPPKDLQPMGWGDSNALKVGDPVMAIGNPLGLSNTVTTGIVSALDRPVTTRLESDQQDPRFPTLEQQQAAPESVITAAIQTNAAINPGNSGGALVDASGQLVGITSSIASLSGGQRGGGQAGNIGIGFAIGSDQAQHVVRQLIETGKATYPQIGVSARDTQAVGQLGAEVASVVDGSPAARAGLRPGDIITSIAGRQVSSTSQLVGLVRAQEVGKTVQLSYVRGDQPHTVEITLAAAAR